MSKSLRQVLGGSSFVMVALMAGAHEEGGSAASHASLTARNGDKVTEVQRRAR